MTDLLKKYLSNLTQITDIVGFEGNYDSFLNIYVEVSPSFKHDYCVESSDAKVILKAKNDKIALWLTKQYIKELSHNDSRINADDLPPSIIDWEKPYANFDFVYREPHFSPNLTHRYVPAIGANSTEEYWDLWGHNLYKELSGKKWDKSVYALQKGQIETAQVCFSSDSFFRLISEYISQKEKNKEIKTGRFVIMPKDTMIVCDCDRCKKLGNSANHATPSVYKLIEKLTEKFPKYSFYTVAYHNTLQPPPVSWQKNKINGILVSTSDLPKGIALNEQDEEVLKFKTTVNRWKFFTDTIYVWDYAANFSDFLTPLPILYTLKKNLEFFRKCGIKGVFLQGSSYEYSPFDDMKTYVATSLMINGQLDVDTLCRRYFSQYYPKSGKILADYYLSLEKSMDERKIPYDMHGSLDSTIVSYFNVNDFKAFYKKFDSLISVSEIGEKERLEKLYTALSFTMSQILLHEQTGSYDITEFKGRTIHKNEDMEKAVKQLSKYDRFKDFTVYREKNGKLENYLNNWGKYLDYYQLSN